MPIPDLEDIGICVSRAANLTVAFNMPMVVVRSVVLFRILVGVELLTHVVIAFINLRGLVNMTAVAVVDAHDLLDDNEG